MQERRDLGYFKGVTEHVIVFRPPICPVCGNRIVVYKSESQGNSPRIRYVKCSDDACVWRGKMIEDG